MTKNKRKEENTKGKLNKRDDDKIKKMKEGKYKWDKSKNNAERGKSEKWL